MGNYFKQMHIRPFFKLLIYYTQVKTNMLCLREKYPLRYLLGLKNKKKIKNHFWRKILILQKYFCWCLMQQHNQYNIIQIYACTKEEEEEKKKRKGKDINRKIYSYIYLRSPLLIMQLCNKVKNFVAFTWRLRWRKKLKQ